MDQSVEKTIYAPLELHHLIEDFSAHSFELQAEIFQGQLESISAIELTAINVDLELPYHRVARSRSSRDIESLA